MRPKKPTHTDTQFAAYTKILEQYMSSTNQSFGQLHQQVHELSKGETTSTSTSTPDTEQDRVGEEGVETQLANLKGTTAPNLILFSRYLRLMYLDSMVKTYATRCTQLRNLFLYITSLLSFIYKSWHFILMAELHRGTSGWIITSL